MMNTPASRLPCLAGLLPLCVAVLLLTGGQPAAAQQPAGGSKVDQLALQQGALADKYTKLEKLLDDMARIEAVSNARRASLLLQGLKQSKERLTAVKLETVARLLSQEQLNRALENQREAQADMKALLELLLSENRSDRLKREQERIREYIKEVERIIRLEKSVQGRTEGGGDPAELAKDQEKIAGRTGDLAQRIRENEEGAGRQGEGAPAGDEQQDQTPGQDAEPGDDQQPADGQKPADDPSGDGQPAGKGKPAGEGQKSAGAKNAGDKKQPGESGEPEDSDEPGDTESSEAADSQDQQPGDQQPGEPSDQAKPPGEGSGQKPTPDKGGKPQPGQQQGGEQGEAGDEAPQDQQQDENPARKRIEAAEQRMREAQRRLEEAKRDEAVEEQEKARQELEAAKAELERILRQLREEEVERVLALLEGRFRKMLEIQLRIYEDTLRLDKVPEAEKDARVPIPAGKLATEERKLLVEADKALNLLLEEGSSIAFPETVSQMCDDMQQVSERLDAANVGRITQSIEEDIIAALEELIAALQKAQRDLEQQQQEQQQQQPGSPQDQPLVDALAELRMVRALQMRVNTRTQRYARLLDDIDDPTGQATDRELVDALSKLAERQERIYRITRDLVLGRNR